MPAKTKRLTKGAKRHHQENVAATYLGTVQTTFLLSEKPRNVARLPVARPDPAKPGIRPRTEPFWLYLFQDGGDFVLLTHEIFVDDEGFHHPFTQQKATQYPQPTPGTKPPLYVLLPWAHSQHGMLRYFVYYALVSPFRVDKSRLDHLLPKGHTDQPSIRKQFLALAKDRELRLIGFSPSDEKNGVVCELSAPWLKAQALAANYFDKVKAHAKEYLDKLEIFQVADLANSLSGAFKLDDYVETGNIKALKSQVPRLSQACLDASKEVADYFASPPFQEMLLDMWADPTQNAPLLLSPSLAYCYRAVSPDRLVDFADTRFLDHPINSSETKYIRRGMKGLSEVNTVFATAIAELRKPGHRQFLNKYGKWAEAWASKVLRTEILWVESSDRFDAGSIDKLRKMGGKGAYFHSFVGLLDFYNLRQAYRDFLAAPHSPRAAVAMVGASSSFASSVAKLTLCLTPDPKEIAKLEQLAGREAAREVDGLKRQLGTFLLGSEESLLVKWSSRKYALKIAGAVRKAAFSRSLGVISGAADIFTAYFDLRDAIRVGDSDAIPFYALTVIGGAMIVLGVAAPGSMLLFAAIGQGLEMAGLVGSSLTRASDLEVWLRFCHFGRRNAFRDTSAKRSWTGGETTLGQVAQSPRLQIKAFYDIVFRMEVEPRFISYARLGEFLDISVRFPYGYPPDSQLYLRLVLDQPDGTQVVLQPLEPWPCARRDAMRTRKVIPQESHQYPSEKIPPGTKSITIALWLDINNGLEFYPENGFLIKTFKVDDIDKEKG